MKQFKVAVENDAQRIAAQQALFKMGYSWASGSQSIVVEHESRWLFAYAHGQITFTSSEYYGRAVWPGERMYITKDGKLVDQLPVVEPDVTAEAPKQPRQTARSRAGGPSTSAAAAMSFDPTKLELDVLNAVRCFPDGATQDDVLSKLRRISHSSITPRFRPLLDKGLLIDTGLKRKGISGRGQRVLKVAE